MGRDRRQNRGHQGDSKNRKLNGRIGKTGFGKHEGPCIVDRTDQDCHNHAGRDARENHVANGVESLSPLEQHSNEQTD